MEIIILSGMSGAGKSKAAAILEDMGFYCVDNMPIELIPKFAEMCFATKGRFEHVVLVVDVRGGKDFNVLFDCLDNLKSCGNNYKILFFEASTDVIINRYKETRRRHPLQEEGMTTEQVIARENQMLESVRTRANYIIDTSLLTTGQLRERLLNLFSNNGMSDKSIVINVMSFGFKYGVPPESDLVFDVRFLPNPYYLTELRTKTGLDKQVYDYVFKWQQTKEFLKYLYGMIDYLIPQYIEEGKTSLVISIGCTGGKHRSVAIAKDLNNHISDNNFNSASIHRDIEKE